jgi:hypothetical protein
MNKKFLISWLVVFVVWFFGSFAVHGALLGEDYAALGEMMRSEEEQMSYFHYMVLAHISMAGAFVWIYQRGINSSPWIGQGIRYGIAVALLAPIPVYLIYYSVQPLPSHIVLKQIIGDGLLLLVLGIVTAALNKPAAKD